MHKVWPDQPNDAEAWEAFTQYSNAALSAFHVRVQADTGTRPARQIGATSANLYQVAVLQLVNDMSDHVDFKTCPHCGTEFVRQQGRGHEQSRLKGVVYCSASCSRAAGVKAYRARKRAERESGNG